jgi:hypothetical protein
MATVFWVFHRLTYSSCCCFHVPRIITDFRTSNFVYCFVSPRNIPISGRNSNFKLKLKCPSCFDLNLTSPAVAWLVEAPCCKSEGCRFDPGHWIFQLTESCGSEVDSALTDMSTSNFSGALKCGRRVRLTT